MKVVFFGTPKFALPSLNALLESHHQIACVVTRPDRRKGRGRKISPSPVKVLASRNNLLILQPEDITESSLIDSLRGFEPNLFVVVAYGKILPIEILEIPSFYSINLHPSLLPKYRGPAPINWTIINGEKETGVTIFKMDEQMDRGKILVQKKVKIEDDETTETLTTRLAKIGATALMEAIELIEEGKATLRPQAESEATVAPMLRKEDGRIDWAKPSLEIHNFVRGMNPWPSAFTRIEGGVLKVWRTKLVPGKAVGEPSEVIGIKEDEGMLVATGDGQILITELQIEGKTRMQASQFLLGHKIPIGERLT